jgi:hypothetical protein
MEKTDGNPMQAANSLPIISRRDVPPGASGRSFPVAIRLSKVGAFAGYMARAAALLQANATAITGMVDERRRPKRRGRWSGYGGNCGLGAVDLSNFSR